MAELFAQVALLEAIAVVFAVAYLVLAIRQNLLCWFAAFISSVLSIYVFAETQLFMQAALQVFYAAMAVYGWRQWTRGGSEQAPRTRVHTWPMRNHVIALVSIVAASELIAWGLSFTTQAMPRVDSFATVASILATWMVAHKLLENWIYWFVIDSVLVYLYFSQGLMLYAGLFVVYLVLVVIGHCRWLADLRRQLPDGEPVAEPS